MGRFLKADDSTMCLTLLSAILRPLDSFVQHVIWCDANKSAAGKAIVSLLAAADSNPMSLAQRDTAALLRGHRAVGLHLLEQCVGQSQTPDSAATWTRLAVKLLKATIAISCGLFLRVGWRCRGQPCQLFAILAAQSETEAMAAAEGFWATPACCRRDDVSSRVRRLLSSPLDLLRLTECLRAAAGNMTLSIADLARALCWQMQLRVRVSSVL